MEFLYAILSYPVRVLWHVIKALFRPQWSAVSVVHHQAEPPPWLDDFTEACGPLLQGFAPAPWAPDGHSQTLLSVRFFSADKGVEFRREILETLDQDRVALDWAHYRRSTAAAAAAEPLAEDAPVCLLLHGMSGCSDDMQSAAAAALAHGMRAVALSKRGHARGLDLAAPKLLNLGDPVDLRHIVVTLKRRYPAAPLVAIGSSAGGGLLASYVNDYPTSSLLDGMVCVSPGFDCERLFSTDGGTVPWPYSVALLHGMKAVVEKNAAVLRGHLDVAAVRRARSFNEFNALVDLRMYGLASVEELWAKCNPLRGDFIDANVPTMCISALDDPVIPEVMIPMELFQHSWKPCVLLKSQHGGHCGFLEGWSGLRWDYRVSFAFLKLVAARKCAGL